MGGRECESGSVWNDAEELDEMSVKDPSKLATSFIHIAGPVTTNKKS